METCNLPQSNSPQTDRSDHSTSETVSLKRPGNALRILIGALRLLSHCLQPGVQAKGYLGIINIGRMSVLAKASFRPWPVCGLICCIISLLVNRRRVKSWVRESWEIQIWGWGGKEWVYGYQKAPLSGTRTSICSSRKSLVLTCRSHGTCWVYE